MGELNKDEAVGLLNRILEQELAGVVRYTHYSLLVFGFNRIPIVEWLREQAAESLTHAQQAGEMITHLGAYPSLTIGPLLDTHRTDIGAILRESLASESQALALYKELLLVVEGKSVMLEEYARQMVQAEELHAGDVDKMLRQPGEVAAFIKAETQRWSDVIRSAGIRFAVVYAVVFGVSAFALAFSLWYSTVGLLQRLKVRVLRKLFQIVIKVGVHTRVHAMPRVVRA